MQTRLRTLFTRCSGRRMALSGIGRIMSQSNAAAATRLELQREILRSERNRAALVTSFLVLALAIYLVIASSAMMSDMLTRGFVQQRPFVVVIFAIGVAFEVATWAYAG